MLLTNTVIHKRTKVRKNKQNQNQRGKTVVSIPNKTLAPRWKIKHKKYQTIFPVLFTMAARFLALRGTGTKIQEKGLISHQKFTFKSTRHLHAGGRISTHNFLYTIPNKDSETVRYQEWARKK